MNLETAHNIFQIPKGIKVTDDYLHKRYRWIAKEIHPDMFTNPTQKIIAHNRFIELNKAYEYLKQIDLSERTIIEPESIFREPKHTEDKSSPDIEYKYENNKDYWYLLYFIFIPGAFLVLPILLTIIIILVSITGYKEDKDTEGLKVSFYLIFGLLSSELIALFLLYDYIIKINKTILFVVLCQAAVYFLYFIFSEILSIKMKRKMKKDVNPLGVGSCMPRSA